MVSEVVDMRAAFSVRMGLPLPSAAGAAAGHHTLYQQAQAAAQHHAHHHVNHIMMPSGPPFFPPPPPSLDSGGSDFGSSGGSPESPGFIHKQMQLLEQAGHHTHVLMSGLYPGAPITDAQVPEFTSSSDAIFKDEKRAKFCQSIAINSAVLLAHSASFRFYICIFIYTCTCSRKLYVVCLA